MLSSGWIVCAVLGALMLPWLALRALNRPRELRFRQRRVPLSAMLYCVVVAGSLWAAKAQWVPWAFTRDALLRGSPVEAGLATLAAHATRWLAATGIDAVPLLQGLVPRIQAWLQDITLLDKLNIAVLLGFVAVKAGGAAGQTALDTLRRWLRKIFRANTDPKGEDIQADPERLSAQDPFYHHVPGQGVVLRDEWLGVRTLLNVLAWTSMAWLAAVLLAERFGIDVPLALLPALPVLVLFECAWYLGGPSAKAAEPRVVADDETSRLDGRYRPLWDAYRAHWPEHWLAAAHPPAVPDVSSRHAINRLHSLLATGVDLLTPCAQRELVDEALLVHATRVLARGDDVLLLLPDHGDCGAVMSWLSRWIRDRIGVKHGLRLEVLGLNRPRMDDAAVPTVTPTAVPSRVPALWVALPSTLVDRDNLDDLARTGLIVLTNVGDSMSEPVATSWALNRLRLVARDAQLVMLGEPREHLLEAVRRNFPTAPEEVRPGRRHAAHTYVIAWATDAVRWYQQEIFASHTATFMGPETALATLAWTQGAMTVRLGDQRTVPWRHNMETLQNHRHYLRLPEVRDEDLEAVLQELFSYSADSWFSPQDTRAVMLVRDELHNLPATIDKWVCRASQSVLLHVASPPYMLREYFAAHLDYFFQSPALPLTPKLKQAQAMAWALAEQLRDREVSESLVRKTLARTEAETADIGSALRKLLRLVLDENGLSTLTVREEDDVVESQVRTHRWYRLAEHTCLQPQFRLWALVDEDGRRLGRCRAAQLHQRYLPGQLHVFDGRVYSVLRHDTASLRTVFAKAVPRGEPCYRSVIDFELRVATTGAAATEQEHRGACVMTTSELSGTLNVVPRGYFRFMGPIVRTARQGAEYYDVQQNGVLPRDFDHSSVWRFSFRADGQESAADTADPWTASAAVSRTLALLLDEMLPTMLPGSAGSLYVAAASPAANPEDYLRRVGLAVMNDGDVARTAPPAEEVEFYVLEDCNNQLGLAQAFVEEWPVIFGLLYDYLCWLLDERSQGAEPQSGSRFIEVNASPRGPYLGFGSERVADDLALNETRAFLEKLNLGLEHTENSHRAQRARFMRRLAQAHADSDALETGLAPATDPKEAESLEESPADMNTQGRTNRQGSPESGRQPPCTFCAWANSADYAVLSNGRYRCARCSLTALRTQSEMEQAVRDAYRLFERTFAFRPRRLDVEFLDRFDFSKVLGEGADAGWRWPDHVHRPAVGLLQSALVQQGEGLKILLATGLPHAFAMAELVRQLTLAWQHEHLDLSAMSKHFSPASGALFPDDAAANCRLLIEGHAAWASLRALAGAGLLPELQKRLRAALESDKEDTYRHRGIALIDALLRGQATRPFRALLDDIKGDGPGEPFAMLERRWPKQAP